MRNIEFKCQICKKKFISKKACRTRIPKFCSKKCYWKSIIGKKPTQKQLEGLKKGWGWNKGLKGIGGWKWSEESKRKLSNAKKGKKLSEYHRKKLSEIKKGKPVEHFNTKEVREKIRKALLNKPQPWNRGEKHHNWQGGKTKLNDQIRNSLKYKIWRIKVLKKDNFICQICGKRGGQLQVDHKKKFAQILFDNKIKTLEEALNCEELWNLENGRVLCKECHLKTETWGGGTFYKGILKI